MLNRYFLYITASLALSNSACAESYIQNEPEQVPPATQEEAPTDLPQRWKADHERLRACLERRPPQVTPPTTPAPAEDSQKEVDPALEDASPSLAYFFQGPIKYVSSLEVLKSGDPIRNHTPNLSAVSDIPQSLNGTGELEKVIQAAKKQIKICEARLNESRSNKKYHPFLDTVKVGSCNLTVGDWCKESARKIQQIAEKILAEAAAASTAPPTPPPTDAANPPAPEVQIQITPYQKFLIQVRAEFASALLKGADKNSRGEAVDAENNVRTTGYYTPELEASRLKSDEFAFPVYASPKGLQRVEIDPVNKTRGWRLPDGNGGWIRAPKRSEIETDPSALAGKEILYLRDPLTRNDLQLQGSGIVKILEPSGEVITKHLQFAGDNGYTSYPIARIASCELIQRGKPFTENYQGRERVKPGLLGGKGLKDYLYASESPAWSKYFELIAESESITFFRERPNRGTDGLYGILLTENVSLATDQTQIPFGFPVISSAKKDGSGSFLGFAQDTGGVIKGAHVDIFVGEGDAGRRRTNDVSRIGAARLLVPKSCGIPEAPR